MYIMWIFLLQQHLRYVVLFLPLPSVCTAPRCNSKLPNQFAPSGKNLACTPLCIMHKKLCANAKKQRHNAKYFAPWNEQLPRTPCKQLALHRQMRQRFLLRNYQTRSFWKWNILKIPLLHRSTATGKTKAPKARFHKKHAKQGAFFLRKSNKN